MNTNNILYKIDWDVCAEALGSASVPSAQFSPKRSPPSLFMEDDDGSDDGAEVLLHCSLLTAAASSAAAQHASSSSAAATVAAAAAAAPLPLPRRKQRARTAGSYDAMILCDGRKTRTQVWRESSAARLIDGQNLIDSKTLGLGCGGWIDVMRYLAPRDALDGPALACRGLCRAASSVRRSLCASRFLGRTVFTPRPSCAGDRLGRRAPGVVHTVHNVFAPYAPRHTMGVGEARVAALVQRFPHVERFDASAADCELSRGAVERVLRAWQKMIDLDLTGNVLGALAPELAALAPTLRTLRIGGNALFALPHTVGALTELTSLDASNNKLTTLDAVGSLVKLQHLDLGIQSRLLIEKCPSANRIIALPPQISQLTALVSLNLAGNSLSGELSPHLGALASTLTRLDLSANKLSRVSVLGELTKLTWIALECNQLAHLPASIGDLTDLTVLLASCNELVRLPAELAKLTSLRTLDVAGNLLTRANSLPDKLADGSLDRIVELTYEPQHNATRGRPVAPLHLSVAITAWIVRLNARGGRVRPSS